MRLQATNCLGTHYKPFPVLFHVSPAQTAPCKGTQWLAVQQSSLPDKYKPRQTWKCWFHVVGPSQTKQCTLSTTASMLLACQKKGSFSLISSPASSWSQPEAEHPRILGNIPQMNNGHPTTADAPKLVDLL